MSGLRGLWSCAKRRHEQALWGALAAQQRGQCMRSARVLLRWERLLSQRDRSFVREVVGSTGRVLLS